MPAPPSTPVRLLAWVVVGWCLAFAAVNVAYEVTDRFASGPHAEYANALSVMNWLVVALKVVGAAVALLTVTERLPTISANLRTMAVWCVFALLGMYSVGNVAIAVRLALGSTDSREQISAGGIAYVVFFLAGAAGYGVLALSFSRRSRSPHRYAMWGIVAAPLVLAALLLGAPAVLTAIGLAPNT